MQVCSTVTNLPPEMTVLAPANSGRSLLVSFCSTNSDESSGLPSGAAKDQEARVKRYDGYNFLLLDIPGARVRLLPKLANSDKH